MNPHEIWYIQDERTICNLYYMIKSLPYLSVSEV